MKIREKYKRLFPKRQIPGKCNQPVGGKELKIKKNICYNLKTF